MIKRCSVCGKRFETFGAKKYCSRGCAASVTYYNKERKTGNLSPKDTLCWFCKNACGNCSWSRSFKPVEGWCAEETKIKQQRTLGKDIYEDSFIVKKCPEYERG